MGTGVAGMIIKLAQGLPAALTAPAPDSAAVDAAASPSLAARRASFLVLVAATTAGMLWLMVGALPARSSAVLNAVVLFLFAMTLPWIAIGFWNSLIGFLLLRFARDSAAAVTPVAARIRGDEPVTGSTAILMCIRNEVPDRVIRNLPVAPLSNCTNATAASRGSGGGLCEKILASTAAMGPARLTKASST
jgi:membrane glycosyltransferase